jgi:signal transduction histidine kinase
MKTRNQLLLMFFIIAILASVSASMILFFQSKSIIASEKTKDKIASEVKEMTLEGLDSQTNQIVTNAPIAKEVSIEIHGLRNFLLVFNFAVIMLALFVSYHAEKSFTRPLKQLRMATGQMSEGIFKTRVEKNSNKEISELAESFNAMADALDKKFKNTEKVGFMVSHDLRGPLNNIIPLVNYIKEDNKNLSQESVQMLNMIEAKALQMNELIGEILNSTRLEKKIKETIDTTSLVNRTVSNLELPSNVEVHIAPNLPIVNFYKTPLVKIFNDIIATIVKHIKNREIKIEISYLKEHSNNKFSINFSYHTSPEEFLMDTSFNTLGKFLSDYGIKLWIESCSKDQTIIYFTIPKA